MQIFILKMRSGDTLATKYTLDTSGCFQLLPKRDHTKMLPPSESTRGYAGRVVGIGSYGWSKVHFLCDRILLTQQPNLQSD